MKTLEERFASKYAVDPRTGCWIWTAAVNSKGYGVLGRGRRGQGLVFAHRLSWELRNGSIPNGLYACHTCDTPRYVNPDHLFLGTPADNLSDAVCKGRIASGARSGAHTRPDRRRLGEDHGNHVLAQEQVRTIRTLVSSGHSCVSVARRFKVSDTTVRDIIKKRTWRHI